MLKRTLIGVNRSKKSDTIGHAVRYQESDLVLIRITSDPATGNSRKLNPKYKGPFRIRKILINDRYEIEDLREG